MFIFLINFYLLYIYSQQFNVLGRRQRNDQSRFEHEESSSAAQRRVFFSKYIHMKVMLQRSTGKEDSYALIK